MNTPTQNEQDLIRALTDSKLKLEMEVARLNDANALLKGALDELIAGANVSKVFVSETNDQVAVFGGEKDEIRYLRCPMLSKLLPRQPSTQAEFDEFLRSEKP